MIQQEMEERTQLTTTSQQKRKRGNDEDGKSKLEKSREAAQQFRDRQKEKQKGLEERSEQLAIANEQIKAQTQALQQENTLISEQLSTLKVLLKKSLSYPCPIKQQECLQQCQSLVAEIAAKIKFEQQNTPPTETTAQK